MTTKHLWEIEHPYRCEYGNFYERGLHSRYESWAEFSRPVDYDRSGPRLTQTGTLLYSGDPDMNCLFRWDWQALHLTDPDPVPGGAPPAVPVLHHAGQAVQPVRGGQSDRGG